MGCEISKKKPNPQKQEQKNVQDEIQPQQQQQQVQYQQIQIQNQEVQDKNENFDQKISKLAQQIKKEKENKQKYINQNNKQEALQSSKRIKTLETQLTVIYKMNQGVFNAKATKQNCDMNGNMIKILENQKIDVDLAEKNMEKLQEQKEAIDQVNNIQKQTQEMWGDFQEQDDDLEDFDKDFERQRTEQAKEQMEKVNPIANVNQNVLRVNYNNTQGVQNNQRQWVPVQNT